MGATNERGFTIIETMLFLAVSGVLIVALLTGAGSSINVQRYRDSVTSLQSNLQDQYFQVMNVSNQLPTGALTCDSNANVSSDPNSPPSARGQGDCVVVGRFITIVDTTMSSSTVVGYSSDSSSSYANDIEELRAYELALLPDSSELSSLEWGARIAWPVSGSDAKPQQPTPRTIALLILRSPTSGLVYTFSSDDVPASAQLTSMVVAGDTIPGQAQRRLCIDSSGLFAGGLAVLIRAYAANSSAIEIRSNDMGDASAC
jgi:type II secretory pathway pseudopilin PulG